MNNIFNIVRLLIAFAIIILISNNSYGHSCGIDLDVSNPFNPKIKPDLNNIKTVNNVKTDLIKIENMNIHNTSPEAPCPEYVKLEISTPEKSKINFDEIGIYIRIQESKDNFLKIRDEAYFRTHISRDKIKAIYKTYFRWTNFSDYTGRNFIVDLYVINKEGDLIGITQRKITAEEIKKEIKIQEPEYQVGEFSLPKLITRPDNFRKTSTDLVDASTRVLYTALIDANGKVIKVSIVSFSGSSTNQEKIESVVINKVSSFVFKPALENGRAVPGYYNGSVTLNPINESQ